MEKIPIIAVWPMQEGTLQIVFETGSVAMVNLSSKLEKARFFPLKEENVWKSAKTDGAFVRWYRDDIAVVEMTCDELVGLMVGSSYY